MRLPSASSRLSQGHGHPGGALKRVERKRGDSPVQEQVKRFAHVVFVKRHDGVFAIEPWPPQLAVEREGVDTSRRGATITHSEPKSTTSVLTVIVFRFWQRRQIESAPRRQFSPQGRWQLEAHLLQEHLVLVCVGWHPPKRGPCPGRCDRVGQTHSKFFKTECIGFRTYSIPKSRLYSSQKRTLTPVER